VPILAGPDFARQLAHFIIFLCLPALHVEAVLLSLPLLEFLQNTDLAI
jgi:hypothetical protein